MHGVAQLCVVADDFGVNAERSRGILSAQHVIGAASLLVNGEFSSEAAELAKTTSLPLRLHFNITEGSPIGNHSYRSSGILTSCGAFCGKAELLMRVTSICDQGGEEMIRDLKAAISTELQAQVRRFAELTNRKEIFMDGHHHVHVLPIVFQSVMEGFSALEKNGFRLRGLRVPHDPSLVWSDSRDAHRFTTEEDCFGARFWKRISSMALDLLSILPAPIAHPHAFIGFDLMGPDCDLSAVERKLMHALPLATEAALVTGQAPLIEIMTHVGLPYTGAGDDPFWHDEFSRSEWRRMELELYTSAEFLSVCEKLSLTVVPLYQ
jgi:predicted glycoside hydrolase/deacetylase ChbG (UPF0249 family)